MDELIKERGEGITVLFEKYIQKLTVPNSPERMELGINFLNVSYLTLAKIDFDYSDGVYTVKILFPKPHFERFNRDNHKREKIDKVVEFIIGRIEKIFADISLRYEYGYIETPPERDERKGFILKGLKNNKEYTFDNFIVDVSNESAYKYIKSIAEQSITEPMTVLLYGSTGLGKSHLLHSLLNELENTFDGVVYFYSGDIFFSEMMSAFSKKEAYIFREKHINADILIIDDLQQALKLTNEGFASMFMGILNERMNERKWTILTTDRHPEDFLFDIMRDTVRDYYDKIMDESLDMDIDTLNIYTPVRDGAVMKYRLHSSFISRLLSGIALEIIKPSFIAKKRFFWSRLSSKYLDINYKISDEENRLLDIFISEVKSDFRYLGGIVNKVGFLLMNENVSLKDALIKVIKEYSSIGLDSDGVEESSNQDKSIRRIVEKLLTGFNYSYEELFNVQRLRGMRRVVRDCIIFILLDKYFYTPKDLARMFNCETITIWRAKKNVEKILAGGEKNKKDIAVYESLLGNVYNDS